MGRILQYNPGSEVLLLNGLLAAATATRDEKKSDARKDGRQGQRQAAARDSRRRAGSSCSCSRTAGQGQECADHLRPDGRTRRAGQGCDGRASPTWRSIPAITSGWPMWASTPTARAAATWACCPTGCPATSRSTTKWPAPSWSRCGALRCPRRQARATTRCWTLPAARSRRLFVMGADPASERPGWAANLDNLDFLVVQELFLTETAQLADVVLPAVSWAEQDGTFTNLERRVQRAPKALGNPHSKAAPDWMILSSPGDALRRAVAFLGGAGSDTGNHGCQPALQRHDLGAHRRPGPAVVWRMRLVRDRSLCTRWSSSLSCRRSTAGCAWSAARCSMTAATCSA